MAPRVQDRTAKTVATRALARADAAYDNAARVPSYARVLDYADDASEVTPTIVATAVAAAVASGQRHVHFDEGDYSFDMSTVPVGDAYDCLIPFDESNFRVTFDPKARISMTGLDADAGGDTGRNLFQVGAAAQNTHLEGNGCTIVGENGVGAVGFAYVENNQSSAINFYQDNQIQNCSVRGFNFENLHGFAIHHGGVITNCSIDDNSVSWCANGINVNGQGVSHSRNRLYKSEGFECNGTDNSFDNNTLIDCFLAAFAVGGGQGGAGEIYHGCRVTNNTISGMTDPDGGQAHGIVFDNATCYGLIAGNVIRGCTGAAILASALDLGGAEGEGHLVANNVCINNSNDDSSVYQIGLTGNGKHVCINNVVRVVDEQSLSYNGPETGLGAQYGIFVQGNGCEVRDNTISASNYGVVIADTVTSVLLGLNNYTDCALEVLWGAGSTQGCRAQSAQSATTLLELAKVAANTYYRWGRYGDGYVAYSDGAVAGSDRDSFQTGWGLVGVGYMGSNVGGVSLGGGTPNAKAILQAESTTQGFLPPRMNSTQRDAISSPPAGLSIFNTTTTKLEVYDGATWQTCW